MSLIGCLGLAALSLPPGWRHGFYLFNIFAGYIRLLAIVVNDCPVVVIPLHVHHLGAAAQLYQNPAAGRWLAADIYTASLNPVGLCRRLCLRLCLRFRPEKNFLENFLEACSPRSQTSHAFSTRSQKKVEQMLVKQLRQQKKLQRHQQLNKLMAA